MLFDDVLCSLLSCSTCAGSCWVQAPSVHAGIEPTNSGAHPILCVCECVCVCVCVCVLLHHAGAAYSAALWTRPKSADGYMVWTSSFWQFFPLHLHTHGCCCCCCCCCCLRRRFLMCCSPDCRGPTLFCLSMPLHIMHCQWEIFECVFHC